MRIVRAQVLEYVRPLDGLSWNPVSRWTERRAPLLVLETETGVRGHAEAWSRQDEIGRVHDALARFLASNVIGRSFDDGDSITSLHHALPSGDWPACAAASAIDMALWDTLARSHRQPLSELLGGRSDAVHVYASGGLYRDGCDAADLARDVSRYRNQGFRDIKIKVGGLALRDDVERIAAARAAADPQGMLWVDAVNQLDADNAVEHARAYRNAGAAAIQAPVAFEDVATMARIGDFALPVIAGESTFSTEHFTRLLDDARVGYLQVNLGLCGGLTGADRIAAMAAARGVPVTVQAHGTALLLGASLHWGAARNAHSVEFHRFHDHLRDAFIPAFDEVHRGVMRAPRATSPESPIRPGDVPSDGATIALIFSC